MTCPLPAGKSLAELAVDEFRARHAAAQRRLALRELTERQAERHLRPWAALALRCGADPAEIHDELRQHVDFIRANHPAAAHAAHLVVAIELCPTEEVRRVVTQARDAMISRGLAEPTDDRALRGRALLCLSIAIGAPAPAHQPDEERIAA